MLFGTCTYISNMKLNTILVHNIETDLEKPGDEVNHFAMLDFLSDTNHSLYRAWNKIPSTDDSFFIAARKFLRFSST